MSVRIHLNRIRAWNQLILGLILPPTCAFCGNSIDTADIRPQLCEACQPIFRPTAEACRQCGSERVGTNLAACLECSNRKKQFAFDAIFALGIYQGKLSEAVVRMKQASGEPLAFAAGRHLAEHPDCTDNSHHYDLATCATKYWTKRFLTGINSPEAILRGLAMQANIAPAADLLVCRRSINKQSLLSPDQRRRNVRNAWIASSSYDVAGAEILVVDDILTTGATAHEMARALKQAGAKSVTIAVVARAKKV